MKKRIAVLASGLMLAGLLFAVAAQAITVSKLFGDVKVYSCPRIDCQVVMVLKGGEKVETVKNESGWALIRYEGQEGWVPRDYLGTF